MPALTTVTTPPTTPTTAQAGWKSCEPSNAQQLSHVHWTSGVRLTTTRQEYKVGGIDDMIWTLITLPRIVLCHIGQEKERPKGEMSFSSFIAAPIRAHHLYGQHRALSLSSLCAKPEVLLFPREKRGIIASKSSGGCYVTVRRFGH